MITYIFVVFVIISTIVTFNNWRRGLFLILVVGALQDPVRKMTLGAPPLFVLSTIPLWIAVFMNVFGSERILVTLFLRVYSMLFLRIRMFLLMLIPGAVVMLLHGLYLWKAVTLGAFGYVGPFGGMIVGYIFAQNRQQLLHLLAFYCFLVALMMSGTIMEYMNIYPGWQVIGTGVMKMNWVKYVSYGHTIYMKAGFFRSPDIMGWHGAMMVMIALTLYFFNRLNIPRWLWVLIAVWGVLCIIISGRYKMVVMPMIWAVVFAALIFRFRSAAQVMGLAVIGVLVIAGMNMVGSRVGLGGSDFMLYAKSPLSYSVQRMDTHAIHAVFSTYQQSGFFGNGLGSATQGARHTTKNIRKGWQEGGLSKITAELGVGGLVFFILLCISLLKVLYENIRGMSLTDDLFYLHAGLVSIIVANAAAFIVSSQIYGDVNILIFFSMFLGFSSSQLSSREFKE